MAKRNEKEEQEDLIVVPQVINVDRNKKIRLTVEKGASTKHFIKIERRVGNSTEVLLNREIYNGPGNRATINLDAISSPSAFIFMPTYIGKKGLLRNSKFKNRKIFANGNVTQLNYSDYENEDQFDLQVVLRIV